MNAKELNTEKLVSDLKRVVQDSEEVLYAAKDVVGDKARELRERLAEGLGAAKRTCRRLEDKAIDGAKAANKTIRKYPYQSIGIGFGLGLLIGALATRK
jgi:ElaB/YqjD/DUF883 family membrane-anchored ribosome-binding protein